MYSKGLMGPNSNTQSNSIASVDDNLFRKRTQLTFPLGYVLEIFSNFGSFHILQMYNSIVHIDRKTIKTETLKDDVHRRIKCVVRL